MEIKMKITLYSLDRIREKWKTENTQNEMSECDQIEVSNAINLER